MYSDATRNEVMLLQKMTHPNIVAYKDSFFSSKRDQLCIVMTYCDGGDLSQRVQAARTRLFKEDLIMHWFVQVPYLNCLHVSYCNICVRVDCLRNGVHASE